jgi:hypothetical protein
VRSVVAAAALVACTPRLPLAVDSIDSPARSDARAQIAEPPPDQVRRYTIWLGGARVGTAIEREMWSAQGLVLRREENLRFARGDALVSLAMTVEVTTDRALVPHRTTWTETSGGRTRRGFAHRDAGAWTVDADGATHELPAAAIPAELAPLVVQRDGRFAGTVFLPARGFVLGPGRIDPVAPHRMVARMHLGGTIAEATIDLDTDGMPARVVDGDGVIAMRATEAQIGEPFPAVDLIAATSVPIGGAPGDRMVLDGDVALPPVPGQDARPTATGVEVELSPRLPGALPAGARGRDRSEDIAALVKAVQARIEPDLAAGTQSAKDAASANAGDCTTYALAYAALATERGIPTRIVTGFRVDASHLIRHRWAVSWTGRSWIAVDAAFGAAPAGGDLVGLAVHDADDAGLVAGEAALTQIRGASWR